MHVVVYDEEIPMRSLRLDMHFAIWTTLHYACGKTEDQVNLQEDDLKRLRNLITSNVPALKFEDLSEQAKTKRDPAAMEQLIPVARKETRNKIIQLFRAMKALKNFYAGLKSLTLEPQQQVQVKELMDKADPKTYDLRFNGSWIIPRDYTKTTQEIADEKFLLNELPKLMMQIHQFTANRCSALTLTVCLADKEFDETPSLAKFMYVCDREQNSYYVEKLTGAEPKDAKDRVEKSVEKDVLLLPLYAKHDCYALDETVDVRSNWGSKTGKKTSNKKGKKPGAEVEAKLQVLLLT